MKNYLYLISCFALMTALLSVIFSFMSYVIDLYWVVLVSQVLLAISIVGILGMVIMSMQCAPIMPYLEAVMKKSMLIIINQANDNLILAVPKKKTTTMDVDNYGTIISNPHSVRTFVGDREIVVDEKVTDRNLGGVKTLLVYEENAVPPETDLVKICQRLESVGISNLEEWDEKVVAGESPIYVKDLDLKVITRYFEYVNPHYLNVRIERIAAELAKEYQQTWQKLIPWVTIMITLMLIGVICVVILKSVFDDGGATASSVPTIIST